MPTGKRKAPSAETDTSAKRVKLGLPRTSHLHPIERAAQNKEHHGPHRVPSTTLTDSRQTPLRSNSRQSKLEVTTMAKQSSTKTNISILRNELQKGRSKKSTHDEDSELETKPCLTTRDHYRRFERFSKKRDPKARQHQFADVTITDQAELADRDTRLGIVDTIAREFIISWLPDVASFLAEDPYDDNNLERVEYKKLAQGLQKNVVEVCARLDCGEEDFAAQLRDILEGRAESCLTDLFEACKDVLSDDDKLLLDPKENKENRSSRNDPQYRGTKKTKQGPELFSEARLLDSTLAWTLIDGCQPSPLPQVPSPRALRFSQPKLYDGVDPTDNGQVWSVPGDEVHKHKFEIKLNNTVIISTSESHDAHVQTTLCKEHTKVSNIIDLTGDSGGSGMVNTAVESRQALDGADGAESARSTKRQKTDEKCCIM